MTFRVLRNLAPIVLLVLATLSSGCAKPPVTVTVPDVVGMAQATATVAIIAADMTVGTVTQAYSATVATGNVISQTPAAGESEASGTVVVLIVSEGPAPVVLPDVVGLTQAAASAAITGAGLTVGTVTQAFSDTVPADSVISQTPAAGANAAPGTAVALTVSIGSQGGGEGEGEGEGEAGGIDWAQATAHAGWSARVGPTSAVFNNRLWVLGGELSNYTAKNDVWWSSDGATWTQATAHAAWLARGGHSTAVFDGKLWVIGGGVGPTPPKNDVWWSSDGAAWTQATASAGWSPRGTATAVFDNKLWVLGGGDLPVFQAATVHNDVWWSSDGATWTQATAHAGWSAREGHTTAVFDNKLWVLGGTPLATHSTTYNDVWWSSDGATWTQATAHAAWAPRCVHTTAVFDNKLWVLGGTLEGKTFKDDVWWSSDGVTWTQATASAGWSVRAGHTTAVFDNKLWVLGGTMTNDGSISFNDVWHSPVN